ncbi:hypothetical protein C8F04DRAFT_1233408 [Mycena alexandri]|uniref:MYND-type domain-containing protein n=1 Tax=Mycena alexandri TaxID=1745969 RepID=A0AAD6X419_9AGAR|nr:hypothetical protein C8F04DRAFT_1233408 [Mycena alexandri]
MAAVSFMIPQMQDALKQPERWNSEWENTIRNMERRFTPSALVNSLALTFAAQPLRRDASLREHQAILSNLCRTQAILTATAGTYFAGANLEERWMKASPDLRGKHILIGLSSACSIARNLHDARVYCGRELTLSHLRSDGRAVLELLKAVLLPEVAMPEEPKLLPHPAWDAFAAAQARGSPNDSEKYALASILTLRTKLICHVIHATLNSFVGVELPTVAVAKYNKKNNPGEPFLGRELGKSVVEGMLGVAGAKAQAKENKAAWMERQRGRTEYCSYGGCSKANDGSAKFSRCKTCWDNMQREILYCSTECQKADWKPQHKSICGKPLTFEAVSKPPPPIPPPSKPAPQIGPAVGNYKRSPSLVYQIGWLNLNPKLDYVVRGVAEETNLDFPDPEAQALFRQCREKAMTTGDKQSIAIMAHFICWMTLDNPRFHLAAIVEQLKKEYVFDELPRAIHEMQQRQNKDPFRRPPLLAQMSPQNWVNFCKGMNVNRQVVLEL